MPAQPAFSPATLKFLRGLKRNNDRTWFNERKPLFERDLKEPLLGLIAAVNDQIAEAAPDYLKPPAKTMLRIYRDIRFSPDKRPYKHHGSAWWGRPGNSKTSGAGFYLHLSGTEFLFGAGVFNPTRDQLLLLRRFLLDHAADFHAAIKRPALRRLGLTPASTDSLTRAPKGFPPDHPAIDLVRQQRWGVALTLPAEQALQPDLPTFVARRILAALPLVELLNQPFAPRRAAGTLVSPLPF